MPNNGVIIVITSAGSHQLELEKTIKEKSLKKNIKIYFALFPHCPEICEDSLPVYGRLSEGLINAFNRKGFRNTVIYTVCICWQKTNSC